MTTIDEQLSDVDRPPLSNRLVWPLAGLGALAVLISNVSGIAVGDDGVGYRATADSLLDGHGLQYFLEHPLTVWPPLWPSLMALVAKITPLDTVGAAVLLNVVVTMVAVVATHRLLRRCLRDDRLVLAGTAVVALGGSTIGFGHLLMTDFAFSVVVVCFALVLLQFRDRRRVGLLVAAAALVWLGFFLRYAALYLIPLGGLWLVLLNPTTNPADGTPDGTPERTPDGGPRTTEPQRQTTQPAGWWARSTPAARISTAAIFGVIALIAPVAWMLRNRSLDGTFTGPRYPSERGIAGNAYDIAATLGKFLLPGVANGRDRIWALVGLVVVAAALVLGTRVLLATRRPGESTVRRTLRLLGGPTGLMILLGGGYLAYMLYVRSTTALNRLDLRLLEPAYLPLMVCGLCLLDRVGALGVSWPTRAVLVARVWVGANIAAGLVAVVAFAAGNPYFDGNYDSDTFEQVRHNAALAAIPDGCHVISNLPNALYPVEQPEWSPRRTGLESDETVDDLDELLPTLASTPTCLVWVDEQPRYGHLWTLAELREHLTLEPLATDGDVAVYRVLPRTAS